MAKPLCFMVMPFGVKQVEPIVDGAPGKIDFDALWNKAFRPIIEELGYDPVRADQDTGAGIILEMLERLFFSDLVVADMTIPNGNVYYEIGIRHACRDSGCVLLSATWTKPLFDTNQMRRLSYPLPEGTVTDATAADIREALRKGVRGLADGASPMYQHIPGFPDQKKIDPNRAYAIRKQLDALAEFQARVREARMTDDTARKKERALALLADYPAGAPMTQSVALEMLMLVRDCIGWTETIAYIDALPDAVRAIEFVQELRSLAQSKSGNHELAIAALEDLIARRGDSSERRGLLGGRYKRMSDAAKAKGDLLRARDLLDKAIEQYDRGMRLNLNDFFPSSNLPFLYRERGDEGDEERAALAAKIARLACEIDVRNPWSKPALLTLAFFDQDVVRAKGYAREVRREGAAAWQLKTTIETLERSVAQVDDEDKRAKLAGILAELKALLT